MKSKTPEQIEREEEERVAALHADARRHHTVTSVSKNRSAFRRRSYRQSGMKVGRRWLGFSNGIALGDAIRAEEVKREEWKAAQGEVRSILHKGVWQVPPEKRPAGWEQMNIKEPWEQKPAKADTNKPLDTKTPESRT